MFYHLKTEAVIMVTGSAYDLDITLPVIVAGDEGWHCTVVVTTAFSGIDPVDSEFQDYKGKYGSKFKAFYNRLTDDRIIPKLKKILIILKLR